MDNLQSDEEVVWIIFTGSVSGSNEISEDHGQQVTIRVNVALIEINQKMFDVIMFWWGNHSFRLASFTTILFHSLPFSYKLGNILETSCRERIRLSIDSFLDSIISEV